MAYSTMNMVKGLASAGQIVAHTNDHVTMRDSGNRGALPSHESEARTLIHSGSLDCVSKVRCGVASGGSGQSAAFRLTNHAMHLASRYQATSPIPRAFSSAR